MFYGRIRNLKFDLYEQKKKKKEKKSDNCLGLMIDSQNGILPISHKLASRMSHVWNYLGKCPCFETRFLDNRVIAKWNLKIIIKINKNKNKDCGTRVPWKYSSGTWVFWMELEFDIFSFF